MGIFSFAKLAGPSLFGKKNSKMDWIDPHKLPAHIGIIMDGNGRWAKKRGLPRNAGHKAGADTFKKIAIYCRDIGIQYLTVYAFSTENWKRPKEEIEAIFALLREYIAATRNELEKEKIKIRVIGDISPFSEELQRDLADLANREVPGARLTVNLAINYGGRDEILQAVNGILEEVKANRRGLNPITQAELSGRLYTRGMPEPDLIIRPSGELRLSNFLIWQGAYSELWFSDVLWPDFSEKHLRQAIVSFQKRDRRYGGV